MLSGNSTYSCASCHQQALAFTDGLAQSDRRDRRSASALQHVARKRRLQRVVRVERSHLEPRVADGGADVQRAPRRDGFERAGSRSARTIRRRRRLRRALSRRVSGRHAPGYAAEHREGDRVVRADASCRQTLHSTGTCTKTITAGCRRPRSAARRCFSRTASSAASATAASTSRARRCLSGAMPSDPEAFFHDTGVAAEPAKFRAPTLRNIAVTAPYMHDGSIATLKDVVTHYAAGGRTTRPKSDKVRGFAISPAETDDLVAFLHALTDEKFLSNPAFSNPLSNPDLRAGNAARQENQFRAACMADRVSLVILTAGCPWLRLSARVKSAELSHARSRRAARVDAVRLIDDNESVAAGKALDLMQSGPISRSDTRIDGAADLAAVGWRVGDRARRSCRSSGMERRGRAGSAAPPENRRISRSFGAHLRGRRAARIDAARHLTSSDSRAAASSDRRPNRWRQRHARSWPSKRARRLIR